MKIPNNNNNKVILRTAILRNSKSKNHGFLLELSNINFKSLLLAKYCTSLLWHVHWQEYEYDIRRHLATFLLPKIAEPVWSFIVKSVKRNISVKNYQEKYFIFLSFPNRDKKVIKFFRVVALTVMSCKIKKKAISESCHHLSSWKRYDRENWKKNLTTSCCFISIKIIQGCLFDEQEALVIYFTLFIWANSSKEFLNHFL